MKLPLLSAFFLSFLILSLSASATLTLQVSPAGNQYYNYQPATMTITSSANASKCWFQVEDSNYTMSNSSTLSWYSTNVLPAASEGHFNVIAWCNDSTNATYSNATLWVNYDWTKPTITIIPNGTLSYYTTDNICQELYFDDGGGTETTNKATIGRLSVNNGSYTTIGTNISSLNYCANYRTGDYSLFFLVNDSAKNINNMTVLFTVIPVMNYSAVMLAGLLDIILVGGLVFIFYPKFMETKNAKEFGESAIIFIFAFLIIQIFCLIIAGAT